jgi:hypothetical protein
MTHDELASLLAQKEAIDSGDPQAPRDYERWIADALEALLKTIDQKAVVAASPATASNP